MIKKSQVPSVIVIIVNTLIILLIFRLIDLPKAKHTNFESLILLFVYFFWMIVLAVVNLAVALISFLAKAKESAIAFLVGGIYTGIFGPIAVFGITYLKMVMNG
jgi:hypothetical protein